MTATAETNSTRGPTVKSPSSCTGRSAKWRGAAGSCSVAVDAVISGFGFQERDAPGSLNVSIKARPLLDGGAGTLSIPWVWRRFGKKPGSTFSRRALYRIPTYQTQAGSRTWTRDGARGREG